MRLLLGLLVCALVLPGCGKDEDDAPGLAPWQHMQLAGLKNASGLTRYGDDLVLVASGNDREVYTVARKDLRSNGTTTARTLAVTIRPEAPVMGAERFAMQGYTLDHLWNVPVDFQGVAAQAPNFLYVGERFRRVVFWGRLRRDADGRLASVHLDHLCVAPGAERTASEAGDWRDKGTGLHGLVAVEQSGRQEDLWLIEQGSADKPIAARRMSRFGDNLQGVRARHEFTGGPDCRAISWDQDRLVVLLGRGRGRFITMRRPEVGRLESIPKVTGVPGPQIEGVEGWTGMAHAPDGTVFLVSGGDPAVLAWRKP